MHHQSPRCTAHPPIYSWYPPHASWYPPMYWTPPDVLMISPRCTHDIPTIIPVNYRCDGSQDHKMYPYAWNLSVSVQKYTANAVLFCLYRFPINPLSLLVWFKSLEKSFNFVTWLEFLFRNLELSWRFRHCCGNGHIATGIGSVCLPEQHFILLRL